MAKSTGPIRPSGRSQPRAGSSKLRDEDRVPELFAVFEEAFATAAAG